MRAPCTANCAAHVRAKGACADCIVRVSDHVNLNLRLKRAAILTPRHAAALAYARANIPVFPVRVGEKIPLPYSTGFKDATTDENTINAWWQNDDYNLAIEPEQAGWCVVDLDGQEGIDTWQQLCAKYGLLTTRTVSTPSGGRHLYFGGSLPGSVRKLGSGIDTRGRGSYVLVPPSIVNGVGYALLAETGDEIIDLPEWIETAVQTEHERRTADGDYEADSPARVDEAKRRIRLELHYNGEPQIGDGSDDRSYKLVARLRDIGLTDPTIIDMLEALWAPHFDREWIETKVTNAERYGQNERGSVHVRSPEEANASLLAYCQPASSLASTTAMAAESSVGNDPTTVSSSPVCLPPTFARSFETIRSADYPPVEWVWQDRLLMGMPNLYTGDAGAGKTTLAENLAVACACDIGEFLGAEIEPMPTLLLVGEDAEGQVRDNLAAIAREMGVLDHPGMADIYVRSTITHEPTAGPRLAKIEGSMIEWCMPFAEELAQFICDIGRPLLIVVDPVAEFVQFDHMNPDECRALSMQFCRMLSRFGAGGNTVLMNDHPSKSSMASGHHYAGDAQLKAAVSLFATLLKGEWGGMQTRQRELTLSVQKARYAAESDTVFYRTALSPLFVRDGAPGERREDHMQRVYDHIVERLEMDMLTQRTPTKGDYPLKEVARVLSMSEKDVHNAVRALQNDRWLVNRSKIGSGAAYVPAHLVKGSAAPIKGAKPTY